MKVLFQNHSSLLIQYGEKYLLTDPWFNKPAFGSWLPAFAPYIHPSYLASLKDRLTILISHGHDDHLDDRLLEIFDKQTRIITADFKSPSVLNRLKKLGFEKIETVGESETEIDGLLYSSYIVKEFSHDDAAYLIRGQEGAVIHANDNWHEFSKTHEKILLERVTQYSKESVLLFSQTNSASGHPLSYKNFSIEEQDALLRNKVARMVEGGLRNAEKLGLNRMFSYAGYATPYVKGQGYENRTLFPTAKFLGTLLKEEGVKSDVHFQELYPGDYVNLPDGEVIKAFVSGYDDDSVKSVTNTFYHTYGNVNECISYKSIDVNESIIEQWLVDFLEELNQFVVRRVEGPDSHYNELLGKSLRIKVKFDEGNSVSKTVLFGHGLTHNSDLPNKECFVGAPAMYMVLTGQSLFEDLYTGYNATWKRNPANIYNRDIVMMIAMFSYVYKNRLSQKYVEKYDT